MTTPGDGEVAVFDPAFVARLHHHRVARRAVDVRYAEAFDAGELQHSFDADSLGNAHALEIGIEGRGEGDAGRGARQHFDHLAVTALAVVPAAPGACPGVAVIFKEIVVLQLVDQEDVSDDPVVIGRRDTGGTLGVASGQRSNRGTCLLYTS